MALFLAGRYPVLRTKSMLRSGSASHLRNTTDAYSFSGVDLR